jgi:C1A family cysteine protease
MNINDFNKFKSSYHKKYKNNIDENVGYQNYKTNSDIIKQKNKLLTNYKLAINQFGDQNMDYLKKKILCNDFSNVNIPKSDIIQKKLLLSTNENINWEKNGFVRSIKNQGNCGSCWAFSTVGALETMIDFNCGIKTELSEQQLVDCSNENFGCEGGWMHKAFDYVKKTKGIAPSKLYPYISSKNKCAEHSKEKIIESSYFQSVFVRPNSPESLRYALSINPVCVAVYADFDFVFYKEGIFDKSIEENSHINHAVLLIGYDYNKKIWIIRNSWGKTWGENGNMRIAIKNGPGVAGINSYCILPIFDTTLRNKLL